MFSANWPRFPNLRGTHLPLGCLSLVCTAPPCAHRADLSGGFLLSGCQPYATATLSPLKVLDHLSHSPEPVYAAELFINPFRAQTVPHRRARLDYLHPYPLGLEVAC